MRRQHKGLLAGATVGMILAGALGGGLTASASSGRLRSETVVNCNGVYYGQHGDDDHWHMAKRESNGWYADGGIVAPPVGCNDDTNSAPVQPAEPAQPSTPAEPAPAQPTTPTEPETPAPAPAETTQPAVDTPATEPESPAEEAPAEPEPETTEPTEQTEPEVVQSREDTVFRLWTKNDSEPIVFDGNDEYYLPAKLGSAGDIKFYYEVTPEGSTVEASQNGNVLEGMSAKLENGDNVISFKVRDAAGQERTYHLHVAKQNLAMNWAILIILFLIIMAVCSLIGWVVKYFVRGSREEKQAGLFAFIKARLARGGWRKMLFPLSEFMKGDGTKVSTGLTFYTLLWFIFAFALIASFNTADDPNKPESLLRDEVSGRIEYVEKSGD